MEIDKRIIALIEILGLTPGEFADKINVQRSGISHITSGRNKPSLDFFERTLTTFPEINPEWLIIGKGKPLKDYTYKQNSNIDLFDSSQNTATPLLFPDENINEKQVTNDDYNILSNNEKDIKNKIEDEIGIAKYANLNSNKVDINSNVGKCIKKIIFFYDDNSFEVYENKKRD